MKIESFTSSLGMGRAGQMVTCSRDEAITIIKSLSTQLLNKYPNAGRAEFDVDNVVTDSRDYFSIAVDERM